MLDKIIAALNAIDPKVYAFIQFVLLLILAATGGLLTLRGHADAGSPLIAGALALLKFEVSGKD